MSWLGFLNFIVLQWFGVRLARESASLESNSASRFYEGAVICINSDGRTRTYRVAHSTETTLTLSRWRLMRWVWPLTGWWGDYRWIAKRAT